LGTDSGGAVAAREGYVVPKLDEPDITIPTSGAVPPMIAARRKVPDLHVAENDRYGRRHFDGQQPTGGAIPKRHIVLTVSLLDHTYVAVRERCKGGLARMGLSDTTSRRVPPNRELQEGLQRHRHDAESERLVDVALA
jgi:hypothetical protein